jgi:YfdX protein
MNNIKRPSLLFLMPLRLLVAVNLATSAGIAQAEPPKTDATSRSSAQTETRQAVEAQRKQDLDSSRSQLDQEAVAAVSETERALKATGNKDKKEALEALERATGKVNVLLARNQKAGLIPVDVELDVADTSAREPKEIEALADAARDAVKSKRYGEARQLLEGLRSEIRARTYNLPLATYPTALSQAARLLGEGKNDDAAAVLRMALNTLVVVDKVTSLPLLEMKEELRLANDQAQQSEQKAQEEASQHLKVATADLKRAEALGHVDATATKGFQKEIDELERKLKAKEPTSSLFSRLRESVASVFTKHSQAASASTPAKR